MQMDDCMQILQQTIITNIILSPIYTAGICVGQKYRCLFISLLPVSMVMFTIQVSLLLSTDAANSETMRGRVGENVLGVIMWAPVVSVCGNI